MKLNGRGWQVAAVVGALVFSAGTATQARSLFGFQYGGNTYYAPAGTVYGAPYGYAAPSAYPYATAYNRVPMTYRGASASSAKDYLSAVCQQGTYTWQEGKMPIKVWISDGAGVPGYRPQFGTFIRNGFSQWAAVSNGKLAWQEVKDPSQADVKVYWTNKITERPEGTEAGKTDAYTRYNTATGKGIIYGARMQFLTELPERQFSDDEVEKTTLHECGHCFGLQGHSPYPDDIMYYAIQGRQKAQLSQRDITTMNELYASAPVVDTVALGAKQAATNNSTR